MSKLSGKVEGLYITTPQDRYSIPKQETEFFYEGIKGDKHWGLTAMTPTKHPKFTGKIELKNTRQITILSVEELRLVADELKIPEVKPEWLSPNILVSGIPYLTQLPPGTRFYFQDGTILYNEGQNFPCHIIAKIMMEQYPEKENIDKRFLKATADRRGLFSWVEYPGKLSTGDSFEIDLPPRWENLWV